MIKTLDVVGKQKRFITREELNKLTDKIISIAIEIHKTIGSGFIEKIYGQAFNKNF